MSKRTPERTEFLSDIISAALEGGIGYWSQCSQYQWVETLGISADLGTVHVVVGEREGDETRATIHELDDENEPRDATELYYGRYKDEPLEITLDVVARGINAVINGEGAFAREGYKPWRKIVAGASKANDAGELDSSDADQIIQAGLFGESVYA